MRIALAIFAATTLVACTNDRVAAVDQVYYDWDGRRVMCAAGFDDVRGNDLSNLVEGIERAANRGQVLHLYGHKPGRDFSVAKLEGILDAATAAGVPLLSFRDLRDDTPGSGPGLAVSFDDTHIDQWHELRPLLAAHDARVTFFVTRFQFANDERVQKLRDLADDGHAIEAHGVNHLDAPAFTEAHGTAAWVDDELVPSIESMRAAGFDPTSFAYPFGTRTSGIDDAALEHVQLVRSIYFTEGYPGVSSPCP